MLCVLSAFCMPGLRLLVCVRCVRACVHTLMLPCVHACVRAYADSPRAYVRASELAFVLASVCLSPRHRLDRPFSLNWSAHSCALRALLALRDMRGCGERSLCMLCGRVWVVASVLAGVRVCVRVYADAFPRAGVLIYCRACACR